MKYSEFEREVEKMGLDADTTEHSIFARRKSGSIVIVVYKTVENYVDCGWSSYIDTMTDEQRGQLFDLAYQLAKTPLAEREEEKKYRVKFPSITRWGNAVYLQKDASDKDPIGVDWSPEDFIFYEEPTDYIFTEQEIKAIDERYLAFKVEVKGE